MGISKGFTLVELVASITLISLLAAAAVPFVSNGVRAYNATDSALQTVDKLRYANERLVRELREIRRDGFGNFDITTPVNITGTDITFTKIDGTTVSVSSTIPTLYMAYDAGTAHTLTDELNSITFEYYQADGSTLATDTSDLAFIDFELALDNGASYHQRSRVALRN